MRSAIRAQTTSFTFDQIEQRDDGTLTNRVRAEPDSPTPA